MSHTDLARSRALWNRSHLDLRSDEILAQILDRGTLEDWRALYELARTDPALRTRAPAAGLRRRHLTQRERPAFARPGHLARSERPPCLDPQRSLSFSAEEPRV